MRTHREDAYQSDDGGSRFGRIWLIVWLVIAAVLLVRPLLRSGDDSQQVASASPSAGVELTSASLKQPRTKITYEFSPIEEIRVGDRVVSDNPDTDTPEETAVDPETWRLVKLYAEEKWPDGTLDSIHIETLQPPVWLDFFEAEVDAKVPPPLDLLEMGLPEDLLTTVVAVEPCPLLKTGKGRVVLTTVNHLNNDVWEVTAVNSQGRSEKLSPTGFHKFYSETRNDWVSTKDIHDNEVIRGRAGPLTIVESRHLPGTQRVYNLTVEGEHVYYVSELGLLAHNNCNRERGFVSGFREIRRKLSSGNISDIGEIEAAKALRAEGVNVHFQTPTGGRGPGTADFLVGGRARTGLGGTATDVITPETSKVINIVERIFNKSDQASSIIVNLRHTSVTASQLRGSFSSVLERVQAFDPTLTSRINSVRVIE